MKDANGEKIERGSESEISGDYSYEGLHTGAFPILGHWAAVLLLENPMMAWSCKTWGVLIPCSRLTGAFQFPLNPSLLQRSNSTSWRWRQFWANNLSRLLNRVIVISIKYLYSSTWDQSPICLSEPVILRSQNHHAINYCTTSSNNLST